MDKIEPRHLDEVINVEDRRIEIPRKIKNIAVQNDHNSEIAKIVIPRYFDGHDLSAYSIMLKAVSRGGRADVLFTEREIQVLDEEIELTWILRIPVTSFSGIVKFQISIFGEDFKWQTESAEVNIIKSLDAEPIIPNQLDFVEKFVLQMEEKMGEVEGILEEVKQDVGVIQGSLDTVGEVVAEIKQSEQNVKQYVQQTSQYAEKVEQDKIEVEKNVQLAQEIKDSTEVFYDIDEDQFKVGFKRANEEAFTYTPSLKGDKGREVELRKGDLAIQWKYSDELEEDWRNVVAISDLKGATGKNIQLQKSDTHIQWKVQGENQWNDLVELEQLKGKKGDTGTKGEKGDQGVAGKNIELQKTETHIQWRYVGEEVWNNLVLLSDIKGDQGLKGDNGAKGEKGERGEKGVDGKEIELQKSDTHIQWRYVGNPSWTNLVSLEDLKGEGSVGEGVAGERGFGWIVGESNPINSQGRNGDLFLNSTTYEIFEKQEEQWNSLGVIKGDKGERGEQGIQGLNGRDGAKGDKGERGEAGADGKEIELQKSSTHIQWKYVGEIDWQDLIPLTELKGEQGLKGDTGTKGEKGEQGVAGRDGKSVQLQKTSTHIQWKNVGEDESWNDLVPLYEIKGDQGAKGAVGDKGQKGDRGEQGRNIELQKSDTHIQWKVQGESQWNDLVSFEELTPTTENIEFNEVGIIQDGLIDYGSFGWTNASINAKKSNSLPTYIYFEAIVPNQILNERYIFCRVNYDYGISMDSNGVRFGKEVEYNFSQFIPTKLNGGDRVVFEMFFSGDSDSYFVVNGIKSNMTVSLDDFSGDSQGVALSIFGYNSSPVLNPTYFIYNRVLSKEEINHNLLYIFSDKTINGINRGEKLVPFSTETRYIQDKIGRTQEDINRTLYKSLSKEFISYNGESLNVGDIEEGYIIGGEICGNTVTNLADNNTFIIENAERKVVCSGGMRDSQNYTVLFDSDKDNKNLRLVIENSSDEEVYTVMREVKKGKNKLFFESGFNDNSNGLKFQSDSEITEPITITNFVLLVGEYEDYPYAMPIEKGVGMCEAVLNVDGKEYIIYEPIIQGIQGEGLVPDNPELPTLKQHDFILLNENKLVTMTGVRNLTDEEVKSYYKYRKPIQLPTKEDKLILNADGSADWIRAYERRIVSKTTGINPVEEGEFKYLDRTSIGYKANKDVYVKDFPFITNDSFSREEFVHFRYDVGLVGTDENYMLYLSNLFKEHEGLPEIYTARPYENTIVHIDKAFMPTIGVKKNSTIKIGTITPPSTFKVSLPINVGKEIESKVFEYNENGIIQDGLVDYAHFDRLVNSYELKEPTAPCHIYFECTLAHTGYINTHSLFEIDGKSIGVRDGNIFFEVNYNNKDILEIPTDLTVGDKFSFELIIDEDNRGAFVVNNKTYDIKLPSLYHPELSSFYNTQASNTTCFIYNRHLTKKEIQHNISCVTRGNSVNGIIKKDEKGKDTLTHFSTETMYIEDKTGRTQEDINRVFYKNMCKEFVSENGDEIQVQNAKEGYVLEGEIIGNTVINVVDSDNFIIENVEKKVVCSGDLLVNTLYTMLFESDKESATLTIHQEKVDGTSLGIVKTGINQGLNKITFTTTEDMSLNSLAIHGEETETYPIELTNCVILQGEYTDYPMKMPIPRGTNICEAIIENNGEKYVIYEPVLFGIQENGFTPDDPSLPILKRNDLLIFDAGMIISLDGTIKYLTQEEVKSYYKYRKPIQLPTKEDKLILNADGSADWIRAYERIQIPRDGRGINTRTGNYVAYSDTTRVAYKDRMFYKNMPKPLNYAEVRNHDANIGINPDIVEGNEHYFMNVLNLFKNWDNIAEFYTVRASGTHSLHINAKHLKPIVTYSNKNNIKVGGACKPSSFKLSMPVDRIEELEKSIPSIEKETIVLTPKAGYTIVNQDTYKIGNTLHINAEVKKTDGSYMNQGNYLDVLTTPVTMKNTALPAIGSNTGWFKIPASGYASENAIAVVPTKDCVTIRVSGEVIL